MMTQPEWKSQRTRAKAQVELLQMKCRAGIVTAEALAEAEAVLANLMEYRPPEQSLSVLTNTQPQPALPVEQPKPEEKPVELPAMEVGEFTRLLEELTLQKSGFHREMATRSNRLKTIPDGESAKDLVDEIDVYYAKRNEVAVKINFLKANGRLPEDLVKQQADANIPPDVVAGRFLENLPADKYELSRVLNNLLPRLSKARGKLLKVKDPMVIQLTKQSVAKLEMEVSLVRSRMKSMD